MKPNIKTSDSAKSTKSSVSTSTSTNIQTGYNHWLYQQSAESLFVVSSNDSTRTIQTGYQGNIGGTYVSASLDSKYIAFQSASSNFVTGGGGAQHVYVKDLSQPTAAPILVSSLDSTQSNQTAYKGNGNSTNPMISADGRFVVFQSNATNFVTGATAGQIYMKDLTQLAQPPIIVSSWDSTQSNQTSYCGNSVSVNAAVSSDGRYVVFESVTNFVTGASGSNIFRKDMLNPALGPVIVSSNDSTQANQTGFQGNGNSTFAKISGDGRYVVFMSQAMNFVTNPIGGQIYRKDMNNLATPPRIVSSKDSTQANQITYAGNGIASYTNMSSDGRYVVFLNASSNFYTGSGGSLQVYLKDMNNQAVSPIIASSIDSTQTNQTGFLANNWCNNAPRVSDDGRYVVFDTNATNLATGAASTQVYLKDMWNLATPLMLVSSIDTTQSNQTTYQGNNISYSTWLSPDGKFVFFQSAATNWLTGLSNTHVMVKVVR